MQIVHYTLSFQKIRHYIAAHNDHAVIGLSKKGFPVYDLKRKLRKEHRDLLFTMIRLYSKQLREYDLIHFHDKLPPFRTNTPALAKVLCCCTRTIRNLITRLIEAKAISEKVHRGRRHNYQLVFSPDILHLCASASPKHNKCLEREIAAIENQSFTEDIVQRLPQLDTGNLNKKNNCPVDGVEMPHAADRELTGNPRLQDAELAEETRLQERLADDPGTIRAVPAAIAGNRPSSGEETGARRENSKIDWSRFEDHYFRLFSLIVSQLYPKLDFLADSQAYFIKCYLAIQFSQIPPDGYEQKYQELRSRIMLAADYLKRDHHRFIPIPQIYFNPRNPKGFEGTRKWYADMQNNTRRAEEVKTRYRTMMKAWGGFTDVIGGYLKGQGFDNYRQHRERVESKYGNLVRAFDYFVLSHLGRDEIGSKAT